MRAPPFVVVVLVLVVPAVSFFPSNRMRSFGMIAPHTPHVQQ